MTIRKKVPINYYARDFNTIKESLVSHAKRYYPDTYKDFSQVGFSSLMMDTVSYVGDVLSFYLDYQVNESFLDTANEEENIIKIAKQLGYRYHQDIGSQGLVDFYIFVPASSLGNDVDDRYLPTIKKGSTLKAENGVQFILAEDVIFTADFDNVRVGRVSDEGNVEYYVVKSTGIVVSGELNNVTIQVGDFEKFLKLKIPIKNITEIVSVFDRQGNEYYEVDYLTQDIIYKPVFNYSDNKKHAKALMRPFSVPRRFVVERDKNETYLQFGQGEQDVDSIKSGIIDPSKRILKYHARNYISDESFDPMNLIETDKFGLVPHNTILDIVVRTNKNTQVNIGPEKLNKVGSIFMEFEDEDNLDTQVISFMKKNISVSNEEAILGKVENDTTQEIKVKSKNIFASQNRAVTAEDYSSLVYRMPAEFGAVKRATVIRDINSFKRNLNIYVISEDFNGYLSNTNYIVKENLKTWLNNYKMLNDTIDILDAKVLNIGIEFEILSELENNKYEVLAAAKRSISELFSVVPEIGQPILINEIINKIKNTTGVLDVVSVNVVNKRGGNYSNLSYNMESNLSVDGRYIKMPQNIIYELKFPTSDIKGVVL